MPSYGPGDVLEQLEGSPEGHFSSLVGVSS